MRQTSNFSVDISFEEGYATARAALTMLATIKAHTGDVAGVKRVLRLPPPLWHGQLTRPSDA